MDKLAAPLVDWYCAHQGRPWRRPDAPVGCALSRLVGRGDPAFRGIDFKYPCTRPGAKLAAPITFAMWCVFMIQNALCADVRANLLSCEGTRVERGPLAAARAELTGFAAAHFLQDSVVRFLNCWSEKSSRGRFRSQPPRHLMVWRKSAQHGVQTGFDLCRCARWKAARGRAALLHAGP